MQIIGEKINGTRKQVGEAVLKRDSAFIQELARRQVEAGSNWLDINAGVAIEQEPDTLTWLVETVQAVTDTPLCLDSTNPTALTAAIKIVNSSPMINSISGEKTRLENILPIASSNMCPVIMLAMDDKGIPDTTEDRMTVIRFLIQETRKTGLADELIYVDPLVLALAINTGAGEIALNTIRAVRKEFPAVHIVSGLSNVSFGLPVRSLINQAFLTLAIEAGLDTAILDPLDRSMNTAILATELVLGKDRFCLNYSKAYRAGKLKSST